MPGRSVYLMEALSVDSIQLTHTCRQIPLGCFDEEMVMVGQKTIGVAEPIEIRDHPAEDIQKHASIGIIEVYRASGIPAGHHMVNSSGKLDSQRSGHDLSIHQLNSKIKT